VANRISVIIDVAVDKANASLGSFRKSIADADGAVGKFKVGASAAMDSIKANAGNLAMAGGAALITFGAKAVSAFQETALEAGRMSEALGMPVDPMSRLIEIAGDIGVEAGTLETSLGKMNQTAGKTPQAFDDIGAAIARNKDGTMNVQATFLNVVDALNAMPDAGQRAAAAQKIFGKGWKDMAELIGQGSDTITESMAEVSEAQAISPEEYERAKAYKAAMENLKDVMGEFSMAVGGELVGALTDAAEGAIILKNVLDSIPGENSKGGWLGDILDFSAGIPGMDYTIGQLQDVKQKTDGLGDTFGYLGSSITELPPVMDDATAATLDNAAAIDKMAEAGKRGTQAIKDAIDAYEDAEEAQRGMQSASLSYRQQVADTTEAVRLGILQQLDAALTDEERAQAARDVEAAVLAQADAALALAEDQAEANGETMTANEKTAVYIEELETLVETLSGPAAAEIQAHIDRLKGIPTSINTNFAINSSTAGPTNSSSVRRIHSGGIAGGGRFQPNEVPAILEADEVVLNRGQQDAVRDAIAGPTGTGSPIIINVSGLTGPQVADDIADKLMALRRRNGRLPWE